MDELSKELQTTEQQIAKVQAEISERVATFQTELEVLRQKDSDLRKAIKEAMEANNIKKFENDYIAVTYIAPTTRTTFDSIKFKEEQPEVYEQYTKTSNISDSVRIKVKEIA